MARAPAHASRSDLRRLSVAISHTKSGSAFVKLSRYFWMLTLLLLLTAPSHASQGCGGELPPEFRQPKLVRKIASEPTTCPYTDAAALLKYRDEKAAEIADKPFLSFYAEFFRPIHQQILLCGKSIKTFGIEKEFTNLAAFTKAWSDPGTMLDHGPGAYEDYLKDMPEIAKRPLSLFTKNPAKAWPEAIRRAGMPLIEKKEYKHYDEKSVHRTFTFIENEKYTQFYLFNASILAMITVEKKGAQGSAKPRIHYGEYNIGAGADGVVRFPVEAIGQPSNSHCIHCHPSGPRLLVALPGEIDPDQWASLDMFNRAVQEVGAFPDYGNSYKPVLLGPSMGGRENTCTECHDGFAERGLLNNVVAGGPVPTSTYKITTEWSMPPPPRNVKQIMENVRRLKGVSPELALEFQKATLEKNDRSGRLEEGAAFLKEKGALSEQDFAIFTEFMENAKVRNTEIAKNIYNNYRTDLRNWLRAAR